MSNRAMSWAIECKGLQLATKAVLMLLADCHNGSTSKCFPSEDWLCEHTGLSGRTIRMHLKALEDALLIERLYQHGGRGQGRKFAGYDLKIGINETVKAPQNDADNGQDIAVAGSCHGKNTSLPRQDPATPYKEEPESNQKLICGKTAFAEIWPSWSAEGRKRSDSKSALTDRLNRMAKKTDLETVVKACKVYAKTTDGQYHKGLQVLLKSGQWENWVGQDKSAPSPESLTLDDWKKAASAYCELQVWPRDGYGPAPHELGCIAPAGLLRTIAGKMSGHRWHERITENIPHKEQAA